MRPAFGSHVAGEGKLPRDTHPSLDLFKRETGITVNYSEAVNDNNAFYAKIQPALKARQYTGFDLIVTTTNDPPLGFYIENGYLIPLDHSRMTNFNRYVDPLVKSPAWDPGNRYTMAYQSGWTILAYNTKAIDRPIDSWLDLWDPAFKGKVGMMSIPSETGAMTLVAMGKEPSDLDAGRLAGGREETRGAETSGPRVLGRLLHRSAKEW